MGIPIPGKDDLYDDSVPWMLLFELQHFPKVKLGLYVYIYRETTHDYIIDVTENAGESYGWNMSISNSDIWVTFC